MKILFVAAECDPFIKTGGLGDVIGALPKYLVHQGIETRVVIPMYSDISEELKDKMKFIKSFNVSVGWRTQYCGIFKYENEGVTYYFIDNEYYFKRKGIYGFFDDGERFAFFNLAVMIMLKELNYKPDILHCHDWHTGMVPVLNRYSFSKDSFYEGISTIYTIHNLLFQGRFSKAILNDCFNLDDDLYYNDTVRFYDDINFMKGGINCADKITTVSKTYAKEIKTHYFGEELDGTLQKRSEDLYGIVNGIDYYTYNPNSDEYIAKSYNEELLENKVINKRDLQRELDLKVDKRIPILAIVSRLTSQKGIDILAEILPSILEKRVQLVVLGTGDDVYEEYFKELAKNYPKKVASIIDFDNSLAHRIYAGADIFLMPSLFEPCGLGQLIALRYGTIPIVRETGGLKDTISFYNKSMETGNGFTFYGYVGHELSKTIEIALNCFNDKKQWNNVVVNAMTSNNSWEKSSEEYIDLYEDILSSNKLLEFI
ncbi:glycogen synthase GlgA [Clostridium sp.]|uniref:glycogen synthase GlgA n=1 Tax=Clostridium sp. TaxID=1506 RepID=UPI0032177199